MADARNLIPYQDALPQGIDDMGIADFLARPHQVSSGSFTQVQVRGQTILTQDITNQINANVMWRQKTAGYRYFRGTAVYRLQVNAQPFQAGRLLLHVLPLAQEYVRDNNYYTAVHNATLTEQTQHPNVELDLQETSAVLRVPYVSPTMYYDKTANKFDHGRVYITVLSPLNTSVGNSSVSYTLWLHWEDVSLNGPIFGPESGLQSHSSLIRQKEERDEIQRKKIIPSLASVLGTSASILSTIPILGSVPKIAGSFADAMSTYGFSKPTSDTVVSPMVVAPQRTMVNCDGLSSADVFSLQHTGTLPICDSFGGTKVDEMSFAYLKQVPAYLDHFTWDAIRGVDATLYSEFIGPRYLIRESNQVSGAVTRKITSAPAFVYLSRFFKYWRGGIKITFKFIKTQYHSGRIAVVFNTSPNAVNLDNSEYVLREIVDLRTTNEVSLCIPYLRHTNYLDTYMNWTADGPDNEFLDHTMLGTLQVKVLNSLEAPSTVSSTIDCLVYYSAAENFELTVPTNNTTMNFIPFVPESGLADYSLDCKAIGSAHELKGDLLHNSLCTGDPFTSIKQLLMSYRHVMIPFEGDTPNASILIWPFGLHAPVDVAASNSIYGCRDYLAELSSGFVLARGGVRFYIPSGTPDVQVRASLRTFDKLSTIIPTYSYNSTTGQDGEVNSAASEFALYNHSTNLLMSYEKNSQWGLEVQIPHASCVPSRLNVYTTNIPRQVWANRSRLNISWSGTSNSQTEGEMIPHRNLYRSGADDLCLAYFIGFGPFITRLIMN